MFYHCSQDFYQMSIRVEVCPDLKIYRTIVKNNEHLQNLKTTNNIFCTLMILSNLRKPTWVSLPCDKKLLFFTFCSIKQEFKSNQIIEDQLFHCSSDQILLHEKCYSFLWLTNLTIAEKVYKQNNGRLIHEEEIKYLQPLFEAVSETVNFPVIFLGSSLNYSAFTIQKKYGKLSIKKHSISGFGIGGYHIFKFRKKKLFIGLNIFHCQKGGYITSDNICDEITHCPYDNSDENFCKVCNENQQINCNKRKSTHNRYCGLNLYVGLKEECKKFNSFNSWRKGSNIYEIIEKRNTQNKNINISSVKRNSTLLTQCKPFEIPCGTKDFYCYNFTDVCKYKLNSDGSTMTCKNGNHLENCMHFECNSMFKCVKSYCVLWSYVCDGKWDCPEGDDELQNPVCIGNNGCEYMYKCKGNNHTCVSINNVCDNHVDCPDSDDEFYCNLKEKSCPTNCFCLIYSITCSRTSSHLIFFNMNAIFISVHISDSNLTALHRLNTKVDLTYVIKLPRNNIEISCPILFFNNVLILDLGYNSIKEVKQKCFSELRFLVHITINNNQILYLNPYSFYNLMDLSFLDLSNNPLVNLQNNCFINTQNLKMIIFRNIQFEDIEDQPFTFSGVKIIVTDDYHVSCTSPQNVFCSI